MRWFFDSSPQVHLHVEGRRCEPGRPLRAVEDREVADPEHPELEPIGQAVAEQELGAVVRPVVVGRAAERDRGELDVDRVPGDGEGAVREVGDVGPGILDVRPGLGFRIVIPVPILVLVLVLSFSLPSTSLSSAKGGRSGFPAIRSGHG